LFFEKIKIDFILDISLLHLDIYVIVMQVISVKIKTILNIKKHNE
jgi:hypothetical protein